ncbi:MAG TPA: alkaline phosphatase family protein [Gemmataceae bacterium]|nr:alkaline phosphatase family protein [Gemmataceae bacterium]
MHKLFRFWAFVVAFSLLATSAGQLPAQADDGQPEPASSAKPKLVVLVVFDQMRADYLARWYDQFGEGGFRRMLEHGAWFDNCNYPYALTLTGPGHASFLTGCSGDRHGIIGNEWYERGTGEVYCATTSRYENVPSDASGTSRKISGGGSPERLLAPTVGDVLKSSTAGKGRVIAISYKDRAAILPGGHTPDGAYWVDSGTGRFVTSTYCRETLPDWVRQFNDSRLIDSWFDRPWERLRPDLDYVKLSGPDDVVGEGSGVKQGRTFPHPMNGGLSKPGRSYYEAVVTSPFGNDLVLAFAKKAIMAEHLGEDEIPDLLSVSFSSNDYIGHSWGPDSQEVMDVTLRSDLIVKQLLEFLDEHVGKGRYLVAMSADHGVCPLPEVAKATHPGAVRVDVAGLISGAEKALDSAFGAGTQGKARWIESAANISFVLNRNKIAARGLTQDAVEKVLVGWLKKHKDVLTAYTHAELLQPAAPDDPIGQRSRKSFNAQRSADISVVFKPYHLASPYLTGTTHGAPHEYDTHVPLVVYGASVIPGRRHDAVTPQAITAIFSHALGIKPPAMAEAPLPEKLLAP